MPFRWPKTCQDVMLATEVAQRRPKCPADYEEIARVLSPIFRKTKKPVVLSGRACRERMNGLISKYLEVDKRLLKGRLVEIFNPIKVSSKLKRCQRHAKVNFGDNGKQETSNR